MAPYEYKALGPGEIRILRLHRDLKSAGTNLYCTLEHIEAGCSSEPYTALSYAWGNPENPHDLQVRGDKGVDEGTLLLTQNLHDAIHDLMSSDIEPKVFWIDQISVNQRDLNERSHQVTMFGKIYQGASQVVVYLGPAGPHDLRAIALLYHIYNHFSVQINALWKSPLKEWPLRIERFGMFQLLSISQTDPFGDQDACRVVADILNGAWTERLWMTQEMILNQQTSMLRGKNLIDFDVILSMPLVCLANVQSGFNDLLNTSSLEAIASIQVLKKSRFFEAGPIVSNLTTALHAFRLHKCSDPRDKVFALLGLAGDAEDLKIVADYTKPVAEVYIDTFVKLLDDNDSLMMLSHTRSPLVERNKDFPSWLCNWMITNLRVSKITNGNASKGHRMKYRLERNKMVLVLSGRRVGSLCTHITDRPQLLSYLYRRYQREDSAELWVEFEEMIDHVRASYRGSFDIHCLLSHTLLADSQWPTPESKDGGMDARAFRAALLLVRSRLNGNSTQQGGQKIVDEEQSSSDANLALEWIYHDQTQHRSLWLTEDHLLCLAPVDAQKGDVAAVLLGGEFVYILRPVSHGSFQYIGDAYIHEFMDGQALDGPDKEETFREFEIV